MISVQDTSANDNTAQDGLVSGSFTTAIAVSIVIGVVAVGASSTGSIVTGEMVVIGETMDRVTAYAQQIGAEIYNGLASYEQVTKKYGSIAADILGKVDNAKWLTGKMSPGYKIVDIGIDVARYTRSSSYAMERILSFFYKNKLIIR